MCLSKLILVLREVNRTERDLYLAGAFDQYKFSNLSS
jgi:hypothetical protein